MCKESRTWQREPKFKPDLSFSLDPLIPTPSGPEYRESIPPPLKSQPRTPTMISSRSLRSHMALIPERRLMLQAENGCIPRAVDLGASGLGVDLFTSLSPPLLFFLYSYYHFFSDPSETCSNEFCSLENPCVNSRGKEVVESKGK